MQKISLVLLVLALLTVVSYGLILNNKVNTLNIVLETVQNVLTSTQSDLISTAETLASTQSDLSSIKETLASIQSDLISTAETLVSTQSDLSSTKQTLYSTQLELSSTKQTLDSTLDELEAAESKLTVYENTLGTLAMSVSSNVQPPYKKGFLSKDVTLINKPNATNPTWKELKVFLFADPTDDEIYYINSFNCTDFAEMLHNNAERAGIKAAFVAIHFEEGPPGHALNAFVTSDRGLIYIDSGGPTLADLPYAQYYGIEYDKTARVKKGKELDFVGIGQMPIGNQWGPDWYPIGIVKSMEIYW